MERISIIVPAYNVVNEISLCIKSLTEQTYKNLEIIMVDDGSNDGTSELMDIAARNDSRIKVFHQKNNGAAHARMTAIAKSTGDFIMFCDADDYYETDACTVLMEGLQKYKTDIAQCGYRKHVKEGKTDFFGTGEIVTLDREQGLKYLLRGKKFTGSLCAKIYKRSLFSQIKIPLDIAMNEDYLMNYFLFKKAKSSVFIDKIEYNYVARDSSACGTINGEKRYKDVLRVSKIIYNNAQGECVEEEAKERYIRFLIAAYRMAYSYKHHQEANEYRKEIIDIGKNKKRLSQKMKMSIWMVTHIPFCYRMLYALYNKIHKPNWDI